MFRFEQVLQLSYLCKLICSWHPGSFFTNAVKDAHLHNVEGLL